MSRPWLVSPFTPSTDDMLSADLHHVMITLRMMTGQTFSVVARKDAYFLEVQTQVAAQMGLRYRDIHLMLNYTEPPPLAKIHTLFPSLEENVLEVLLDVYPSEFVCPHCDRTCELYECIEWDPDPSERCRYCNHDNPHTHCYPQEEQ